MDILTILATGTLCIVCFFIGAKTGQTVSKGKEIELPTINPIKAVKEHQEKKYAEMKQHKLDTIIQNIESYDGTGRNQVDVE